MLIIISNVAIFTSFANNTNYYIMLLYSFEYLEAVISKLQMATINDVIKKYFIFSAKKQTISL